MGYTKKGFLPSLHKMEQYLILFLYTNILSHNYIHQTILQFKYAHCLLYVLINYLVIFLFCFVFFE